MERHFLSFIIESTILTGIVYLLYIVLLRNETNFQFNRYFLIAAAVLSVIVPFINFPGGIGGNSIDELNIIPYNNLIDENIVDSELKQIDNKSTIGSNDFHLSFIFIAAGIYFLITVILFVKFILGIIRISHLYKNNPVRKKENYTIVYLDKDFSPFSFLRYIFLNHKYNDETHLETILKHEEAHIHKKHSYDIILLEFISIIQWYNPFIWLIKKTIKELHEFQADEKVIAQGFDSKSYFSFLLNKIVGIDAMDFANCFNKSLIKKRVMMMEKLKSKKSIGYKTILVIPLALLLAAFTINFTDNSKGDSVHNLIMQSNDEIPEGWFEAGTNPLEYEISIVKSENNKNVIQMKSLNPEGDRDFGNLMQTINAEEYIGKRIKFSGDIKTDNAEQGAVLWMRVDGKEKDRSLAFDNMYNRMPKGTNDWEKYEIVLDVPEGAIAVNFGMMLYKEGKAWFANLDLEEVSKDVPTTSLKPKELPKKPSNLDFSK